MTGRNRHIALDPRAHPARCQGAMRLLIVENNAVLATRPPAPPADHGHATIAAACGLDGIPTGTVAG